MTIPANPSHPGGFPLLSRAQLLGRIGGILFLLFAVSLGDSIQSTVRKPFNTVQIVAGNDVTVTGVLPHKDIRTGTKIERAEDMSFFLDGSGADKLSFTPTATYRGFWLGGDMWRGTLSASPSAASSEAVLTIRDLVPARRVQDESASALESEETIEIQNPGLVYSVKIWASRKEANRASLSLVTRTTGLMPPVLAVLSILLAIGVSIFSFLAMRKAEAGLAGERTFIIHGSKRLPHGLSVFFTIPRGMVLSVNETPKASLRQPDGRILAEGTFSEIAKGKGTVLFAGHIPPPPHGWLITLH